MEVGQRRKQHDAGGIHHDVHTPVLAFGVVEETGRLGLIADVSLECGRGTAGRGDCGNSLLRTGRIAGKANNDGKAILG